MLTMTDVMREALLESIQAEQSAHDFYLAAAKKVKDNSLRELFEELAGDELGHRDFLQRVLQEGEFATAISPKRQDYKISEEMIAEKPELSVDMPFGKALELAIKREQEAMDTYDSLAAEAGDNEELRALFLNLRNMEQAHKTNLESIYMNVAYTEVW